MKETVVLHKMIFKNEVPPFIDGFTAKEMLERFPIAKYICTGDNHHGFIYEDNYRYVINPGCLIRQTADLKDYQPFIVYLDMEKEIVKKIFVPDDCDIVDDEYLKDEEKRNDRIEAFVDSIKKGKNVSLSFEDNLRKAVLKNKKEIGKGVIDIIQEIMEEVR